MQIRNLGLLAALTSAIAVTPTFPTDGARAASSLSDFHSSASARTAGIRIARADTNPLDREALDLPCGQNPGSVATQLQSQSNTGGKPNPFGPQETNAGAAQGSVAQLNQTACDDTICVSLPQVAASIHQQLDCSAVGYAFFVGNSLTGAMAVSGGYGNSRTKADPPAAKFTVDTEMQIASTSKVLTALGALRALGSKIGNPASNYFPGWTLPQNSIVKGITISRFISQTSGVMQYYAGPGGQTFANLQSFFTQNIANPAAPYYCPGPPNPNSTPPVPPALPNPIITSTQFCYADTNFGLMRVVLPRAAGMTTSTDPTTLATKYVTLVQNNVFAPIGVSGVACAPPANKNYAYYYNEAGGHGFDWGDLTSQCGDWGWYVSVMDYARVLLSLNANDGKILGNCGLYDMVTNSGHAIGWDITSDSQGHRWLEKNGGDGAGSGQVGSTSVGIYGGRDGCVYKGHPGVAPEPGIVAVLFINSNIKGVTYGADTVLITALQSATTPKM